MKPAAPGIEPGHPGLLAAPDQNRSGPRVARGAAIAAVAATYTYFLLFAEFALLELVAARPDGSADLEAVMFALGAGGLLGAAAGALGWRPDRGAARLGSWFRACALAAVASVLVATPGGFVIAAAGTGIALGGLTVTLATCLQGAVGARRLGLVIGAGTGLAYAICNLPFVFFAPASRQALMAAGIAVLGSLASRGMAAGETAGSEDPPPAALGWPEIMRWTVFLLVLVWLDSAAFYVIQHSSELKGGTWNSPQQLYANAGTHLVFALLAGWLLDHGRRRAVAGVALVGLAAACSVLNHTLPGLLPANVLYVAGVSLYSTVLVEFPSRSGRPWIAAIVFGVAGWIGSGLGIGMARDLAGIPAAFVLVAVAAGSLALWWKSEYARRPGPMLAVMIAATLPLWTGCPHPAKRPPRPSAATTDDDAAAAARGREVYIAEGCLHCHSQYIRPRVAREVLDWGPAASVDDMLAGVPPLPGTRRQGPDLSQVGSRRSSEWNRLHLQRPREVSPGSRMPSYAHLFKAGDGRGDDLVAYLASLGGANVLHRARQASRWTPSSRDVVAPDPARRLFQRLCTPCHGPEGHGDGELAPRLSLRPPDWRTAPWRHVSPTDNVDVALSRTIKFGVPGLPMAGHEYLSDAEILGLARHVQTLHKTESGGSVTAAQP